MNEQPPNSFLYGKGVFSTLLVRDGEPFLLDRHWQRLSRDARQVGLDVTDLTYEIVRAAVITALADANLAEGRARVTLYDNRTSEIWPSDNVQKQNTAMSIIVGPRRTPPRPFKCFVSPHTINSRSPLAGVKSCNYLESILAVEDAKRRGCSEAVRLNERGHVAGACMANVFWLKGDKLFTPSLSTGCLPGTTREFVLENLECEEVEAEIGEIENAEAVFLTSAGLGVVAVDEFNGRRLSAADHPILELIK
jgi:branched-subunit amino acid aminotransferase/4-amino-4-deoxychorismate lyase